MDRATPPAGEPLGPLHALIVGIVAVVVVTTTCVVTLAGVAS